MTAFNDHFLSICKPDSEIGLTIIKNSNWFFFPNLNVKISMLSGNCLNFIFLNEFYKSYNAQISSIIQSKIQGELDQESKFIVNNLCFPQAGCIIPTILPNFDGFILFASKSECKDSDILQFIRK